MNYETAKKLKTKGFPQKNGSYYIADEDDDVHLSHGHTSAEQQFDPMYDYYYSPTLSDLIEACGERLKILANAGNHWRAMGDTVETDYIAGETPDIAVANLYLALHPSE